MAMEIRGAAPSGSVIYSRIISPAGLWWNGAAFEAYAGADYANYAVAMAEQGVSGVYVADFPAAITAGGSYEYYVYLRAGGTPAAGDVLVGTGKVDWTGTAAVSAAAGAMSGSSFRDYLLRRGFKRDDKDAEVYEAVTDAVQEMRRRFGFDEAEADQTTTDTITVLGDYKLNLEPDLGLLVNLLLQDGRNAVPLVKMSKVDFDARYFDAAVTADKGYPRNYCVFAGQLYIGPVPDRTTYSYRVSYSRRGGVITTNTAGVPFTDLYRDVLVLLALCFLYEGLDEFDKAGYYRQQFELGFAGAVRRERKNKGLSTFTMTAADI